MPKGIRIYEIEDKAGERAGEYGKDNWGENTPELIIVAARINYYNGYKEGYEEALSDYGIPVDEETPRPTKEK